jgi:hypothetical protein
MGATFVDADNEEVMPVPGKGLRYESRAQQVDAVAARDSPFGVLVRLPR